MSDGAARVNACGRLSTFPQSIFCERRGRLFSFDATGPVASIKSLSRSGGKAIRADDATTRNVRGCVTCGADLGLDIPKCLDMRRCGGRRDVGKGRAGLKPAAGIAPYRLMRADAGWPGTLKRLPVSVTLVPSTFRMEKS